MAGVVALMAGLAAQTTSATTVPASTADNPEGSRIKPGQITYVDLEGGVGYSTNPQSSFSSNSGAGQGYVSVHAVHTRLTERTTTLLSAFGQATGYTRHYGSNESLSITARHDAAVNEKLRLFVEGNASYDQNGQLDTRIISVPDVPPLPGSPNLPPQILPGSDFLALTGKRYYFSADGGGQLKLSARDALDFSSGVTRSVFRQRGFPDTSYWTLPASIGYDRQLSPRADVGGRVAFAYTDYNGPVSYWTVTPQVTGSLRLSERLTFSGAIGVTFASVDDGIDTRHSTGLAANATLCHAGERSHLCARVSVDQQTATIAGPAKSISAGLDYARELDANSSLQLALDGSHYSQPVSVLGGQNFSTSTYYRAAATYTRSFGHRLFGGASLSVRKITARGPDPNADLNASLFVRYRFGDVQ